MITKLNIHGTLDIQYMLPIPLAFPTSSHLTSPQNRTRAPNGNPPHLCHGGQILKGSYVLGEL